MKVKQMERRPTFITSDAHGELAKLAELLTQVKGVRISQTNAASIAIINETRRLERREQRKLERQQATQ